ncbi:BZ3501_MvSof-1269-A2-R1_Chr3-1g05223 [Microbotryum saponariae]|nr:BZ3501_MvSof-1269-A2-R1_Chr3-1g05223 [Microbotryum saponariae]
MSSVNFHVPSPVQQSSRRAEGQQKRRQHAANNNLEQSQIRSSGAKTPSREAAAQNRSTRRRAKWIVKSICTGIEKIFRERIFAFNEILAMASFGTSKGHGHLSGSGPQSFYLSGMVTRHIGTLAPAPANDPPDEPGFNGPPEKVRRLDTADQQIVPLLDGMLRHHNRRVKLFLTAQEVMDSDASHTYQLRLLAPRNRDPRTYNLPTQDEVAAILPGEETEYRSSTRDIVVRLPQSPNKNSRGIQLIHDGHPASNFVADAWAVTEQERLFWMRTNQQKLRAEQYYSSLQVSLAEGLDPAQIGKRVISPSSQGSPRQMVQLYQDAMAIVRVFSAPDIFITMTCNLAWSEIVNALLPGQTASDRPDIVTRIFHGKLKALLADQFPSTRSSLNVNPRVLHHQLVTLHAHWTSVTIGDPIPKRGGGGGGGGHPPWPAWENDIDSNKYHMFYNKAREGSCNGRKVAKSYATPLPVNVDGHVKLYMHTISRGPPVKGTRSLSSLTDSESKLKGSNGVFAGEERLLKGLRPRDAAAPRARTSVRPVGSRSSLPLRCKQPPYPLLCKVVSHPLLRARANFSRLALSRLAVSS